MCAVALAITAESVTGIPGKSGITAACACSVKSVITGTKTIARIISSAGAFVEAVRAVVARITPFIGKADDGGIHRERIHRVTVIKDLPGGWVDDKHVIDDTRPI